MSSSAAVAGAPPPATLPPATDFLLRPFESERGHPVWVGVGIAALMVAVFLLVRALTADEETLRRYAGVDTLIAVLFGYLPAATAYLRRSAQRDFDELRPVLRGSDEEIAATLARAVCPKRRSLLVAGLIGAAFWATLPLVDPGFWPEGLPPLLSATFLYHAVRQAAMGFLIGRVAMSEYAAVTAYRRLGATQVQVDLLDVRPLRPFARRGLRSGFVWILCSSLISLFWLGPAAGESNAPVMVAIGLAVLWIFFVCVSGVRASIRRAKEEQLARLRAEIRRESEALLAFAEGHADARLSNLIALQGLVERVPEWPFDAPVLLRFGLLALLGLGSWLGGALVERMLDAALG